MTTIPLTTQAPTALTKRSVADLLAPLDEMVRRTAASADQRTGLFADDGRTCVLPRYRFTGPSGGIEHLRVGIFAGIHGDEPESIQGLIQFARLLEQKPELAKGYTLYLYPVCNPTGYEDGTRESGRGVDLNREFWKNSFELEVQFLESELLSKGFHGLIALHGDSEAQGIYGYASGQMLNQNLLEPALTAAEKIIPRDLSPVIDGFPARNGILRKGFEGILRAPSRLRPRPFEIIFEAPQAASHYAQVSVFAVALRAILVEYQKFLSYAANI